MIKYLAAAFLLSLPLIAKADDNPGHLDNPAAIALVQAQIKDNELDPVDFDIQYLDSTMDSDNNGAVQRYSVINKKDSKAFIVIVGVHWTLDTTKTHI